MGSIRTVALLFGFHLITLCAGSCPTFWTSFQGSCYILIHNPSSWVDAEVECRDEDSHLVEIESAPENTFLKNVIRTEFSSADGAWTGGNDILHKGNWIWPESRKPFNMTDWYPGEPSNSLGVENCLEMQKSVHYQWNDRDCSDKRPFICEKQEINDVVG